MATQLQLAQAVLDVLKRRNGWQSTGYLTMCDRCAGGPTEPVLIGDPPEFLLMLCRGCVVRVRKEMGRPGSGYLGEAYWLARAHLRLTPEAGQGPAGPAQPARP